MQARGYLSDADALPKTRVWGSKPENVHCVSATSPLRIELRWGCEESSEKTVSGSGVAGDPDPNGPFSGPIWQEGGPQIPLQNLAQLLGVPDPPTFIFDATDEASSNGTPWYKNACVTGALDKGALSVGIDAIGLIPEAGGIARIVGHQAGYVGVVADHLGHNVVSAVGQTAGSVNTLSNLTISKDGAISTGLTIAGFFPALGELAAIGSIIYDGGKTIAEISGCH